MEIELIITMKKMLGDPLRNEYQVFSGVCRDLHPALVTPKREYLSHCGENA